MCSERKLAANRLNAQKSTGPRTPAGKAESSRNATTHGLTARRAPIMRGEDPAEFEAFAQALRDDLRPRGAAERVLVDRIIELSWKLRRVPAAEAALDETLAEQARDRLKYRGLAVSPHGEVAEPEAHHLIAADVPSGADSALMRLQMYELRIERSLHATFRQLAQLRKLRRHSDTDISAASTDETSVSRASNSNRQNEPTTARVTVVGVERLAERVDSHHARSDSMSEVVSVESTCARSFPAPPSTRVADAGAERA